MNTKKFFPNAQLLILSIALISATLFLGACGRQPRPPARQKPALSKPTNQQSHWDIFRGSLKDLMTKEKALKCTWQTQTKNGAKTSGTIYIQGKKFRQEATVVLPPKKNGAQKTTNYSISDGQWIYSWSSINPKMGIKISLDKAQKQPQQQATSSPNNKQKHLSSPNFNQKLEFKCEKWQPQNSLFIPPNDINFVNPDAMLNNMLNTIQPNANTGQTATNNNSPVPPVGGDIPGVEANKQQACAACKQAPTLEMQQQCLQAAGCAE